MKAGFMARIAALEAARQARMQEWVAGLSETELAALLDETYGAGTWDWLTREVDTMGLDAVERGELWGRYVQWRETQP